MAAVDIMSTWSSLITERQLMPHLENLMNISDPEERGLALLMRVHFLWSIGLRYQRKLLENSFQTIQEKLNESKSDSSCETCNSVQNIINDTVISCKETSKVSPSKKNNSSTVQASTTLKTNDSSKSKSLLDHCLTSKRNTVSVKDTNSKVIFAPETEAFFPEKVEPEHQAMIIPETIVDDENYYENGDIFLDSQGFHSDDLANRDINDNGEISKKHTSCAVSRISKNIITPRKIESKTVVNQSKMSPDKSVLSVQHDQSKMSPNESTPSFENELCRNLSVKSPDSLGNSPSLLACHRTNSSESNAKKNIGSPLKENWSNAQKKNVETKESGRSSVVQSFLNEIPSKPQISSSVFHNESNSSRIFPKFKSETPKTRGLKALESLRKLKHPVEVEFNPSVKEKKIYRQATLNSGWLTRSIRDATTPTGREAENEKEELVDKHDDKDITKVLREILPKKEIEVMLRTKHEELKEDKRNRSSFEDAKTKVRTNRLSRKRTPSKLGDCQNENPPCKVGKCTAPLVLDQTPPSLTEEEALLRLSEHAGHISSDKNEVQLENPNKTKKKLEKILQDSFDVIPSKSDDEPQYAYKGDVVRKKSERYRLEGWSCRECCDYYESKGISEAEKKVLQNKCSRHRSKYRPVTNTPEGFWVVGWEEEELEEENVDGN